MTRIGHLAYPVWLSELFQSCILTPAHFRNFSRDFCHRCYLVNIIVKIASIYPILGAMPKCYCIWKVGNTKDLVSIHQGSVSCTACVADMMIGKRKAPDDLVKISLKYRT